ncbi:MAG: hypothetical protein V3U29_07290, partial [Phycisphaeraceae bacterium]
TTGVILIDPKTDEQSPFIKCGTDKHGFYKVPLKALSRKWRDVFRQETCFVRGDREIFWEQAKNSKWLARYHIRSVAAGLWLAHPLEPAIRALIFAVYWLVGELAASRQPTGLLKDRFLLLHWLIFEPGSTPETVKAPRSDYPLRSSREIDKKGLWGLSRRPVDSCRYNVRRFIEANEAILRAWHDAVEDVWEATHRGTIDITPDTSTATRLQPTDEHEQPGDIPKPAVAGRPTKRPPLSERAAAVYEILTKLPEHRAMTGPQLIDALVARGIRTEQSTLTSRIVPELRPYGIENVPRKGYHIPLGKRSQ